MSRTAVRKWLDAAGFDWSSGRIILQDHAKWDGAKRAKFARELTRDAPELDAEFYDGFGSPEAPCFIAQDYRATYFPSQYDGSTTCVVVLADLDMYLNVNNPTPYPGSS